MSAEYTNNHYVPQWYQRQFIPAGQADRELHLLDLKPEWFRDGSGVRRRRKALRRTGTRYCFAIDDLYTTRLGRIESRELERVFFGEVDSRGKRAVEFFARFDHDSMQEGALDDLMRCERSEGPVECVLELSRDRRVVFRRRDQQCVGRADRVAQPARGRRRGLALVILIEGRDVRESTEPRELDGRRGSLEQPRAEARCCANRAAGCPKLPGSASVSPP